jgi:hypothetical protein
VAEAEGAVCRKRWPFFARTCAQRASWKAGAQDPGVFRFNLKEISIQLARKLRDLLSIQNRQISVENIQKVADYYKIKVADMYSKSDRPAFTSP